MQEIITGNKEVTMNVLGISYKKASLDIRAAFAFTKEDIKEFRESLFNSTDKIKQCVVLSTCNRCEIYTDGDPDTMVFLQKFLCEYKKIEFGKVVKLFNLYVGNKAIEHLIKVACGIDSMVVGEDEILRQLKEAYKDSLDSGAVGYEFNTVFQMSIAAAKDIKTRTGLSQTAVSVGTLAANAVFALPGKNKKVLILGITGKIGSIVALNVAYKNEIKVIGTIRHRDLNLSQNGTEKNISVLNAAENVTMVDYNKRYEYMKDVDAIISATSSPHYTITKEDFDLYVKDDKKRLFIDLAVPQDIDSRLKDDDNNTLYDIDYFNKLASENNRLKQDKAHVAEESALIWAEDIEKELRLHDVIENLPRLKDAVNKNGIEKLVYSIRKLADKDQVDSIAKWFEDYLESAGI